MRSSGYLKLIASVLSAALLLWLGAEILLPRDESYRIVTAEAASVNDEILLAGIIVREEYPLYAEGDYLVLPREGEWLSVGDAVAVKRESAQAYSDFLRSSETPLDAGSAEELFCALSLSKNREEQRSAALAAAALLFGEAQVESLHTAPVRELVCAEFSGYFSRYCDGCESLGVHGDYSSKHSVSDACIGKTVSGSYWFFVAETDAETAKKLSVGMRVTLDGYAAEVEEISERKTVFRVRQGLFAHLTDREKTLALTLCSCEGISVPREALVTDGERNYIRILHIGGEEKLSVDIIYDSGNTCLVTGEGLAAGMQIILP